MCHQDSVVIDAIIVYAVLVYVVRLMHYCDTNTLNYSLPEFVFKQPLCVRALSACTECLALYAWRRSLKAEMLQKYDKVLCTQ